MQAMWRLLMPGVLSFVAKADRECHACISRLAAADDPQEIPELISFLNQEKPRRILGDFVESRSHDVNFRFWWQYLDMVAILLQYTRAQRD